jgi:DNA repair exonuclease SbcCD ATPase subunit
MTDDTAQEGIESGTAVNLEVRNVGGISHAELELPPGVTVLTGRNATNRTSLLKSLGQVLGGTTASIKSDCEEGRIDLEIDDNYFSELTQAGSGTSVSGNPFSEDEVIVDHFVSLLEDNPVRRAVEQGRDLRDILMRPVDLSEIEERIEGYTDEIRQLDDRITEVKEQKHELPSLQEEKTSLSDEIEELDNQLEEIGDITASKEEVMDDGSNEDELVDALERKREEYNRLTNELEVKESERDALEQQLVELQERGNDLSIDNVDIEGIDDELTALREQKRSLSDDIEALSSIVSFSENVLEGEGGNVDIGAFQTDSVTDELVPSNQRQVECWVCGNDVKQNDIKEHLESLREQIKNKRTKRNELDGKIDEIQNKKSEYESNKNKIEEIERKISRTERSIEKQEDEIDEIKDRIPALEDEIADLEEELKSLDEQNNEELVVKYEQISDLQFQRGKKREQLTEVETRITEIEELPDISDLEKQRAELQEEIEKERTRVAELETSAIESFNEHMENLIGVLNYENLSRVWIERKVEDGAALDDPSVFDLHIIRESDSGAGYEDTHENLSESERELIGLVLALAGYLVHDVFNSIPFILLDSLEAIDAERIAKLVEYFEDYSSYLIVALLPEDAAALSDEYHYIHSSEFN